MAGLPWIKVSVDLPRHPKSVLLADRLHDPRAWLYVVQLWCWIAEHEATGDVEGPGAAVLVARGAGWQGDPEEFCRAMVAIGFLDTLPTGLSVHDWDEWAGAHVNKKRKDAARKAKSRGHGADSPPPVQPVSAPGHTDVRVTSGGQPSDGPRDIAEIPVREERGELRVEILPPSLPGREQLLTQTYPATAALISASGDLFAFPSGNEKRQQVERAVAAAGPTRSLAAARASYAKTPKVHLGWHLDALRAAALPVEPSAPPVPVLDLAWLDQLPEPTRTEAHAAWEAKRTEVEERFAADAVPRILASSAEVVRQQFTQQDGRATA